MKYFRSNHLPLALTFIWIFSSFNQASASLPYGTKLRITNSELLEKFDEAKHILIVDLKNNGNSLKKFDLLCLSGPDNLELNVTFSGVGTTIERADDKTDATGRRRVSLTLNPPLLPEYTGRYNCTARYKNDVIETVSWYVYFYPDDGSLFVKCPLLGKLPKCLVFYRINIPFVIPCK